MNQAGNRSQRRGESKTAVPRTGGVAQCGRQFVGGADDDIGYGWHLADKQSRCRRLDPKCGNGLACCTEHRRRDTAKFIVIFAIIEGVALVANDSKFGNVFFGVNDRSLGMALEIKVRYLLAANRHVGEQDLSHGSAMVAAR